MARIVSTCRAYLSYYNSFPKDCKSFLKKVLKNFKQRVFCR
ncbi:hypothetical protein ELI_4271 [Eubacterium callanderi]|uniref:Uncharacterized protein n=1 Tax=Eubacterium callanderi TaxID=53442 RepID=E3GQB9_9FIRM|nr:hypothetical protein ELI_4271 [Eubacterium callanderi]